LKRTTLMRWLLDALMVLAGVGQACAVVWPVGDLRGQALGLLQMASLAVLCACVDRSHSVSVVVRRTWVFSIAWLMASTWWLYISLHVYGGMPPVLAAAAVLLLSGSLALIYAGALGLYRVTVTTTAPLLARIAGFAAAWTLAEWLRGHIATGFPWASIGYAHVDSVLRQWAPWLGVYGIGGLAAAFAMAVGARQVDNLRTSRASWVVLGILAVVLGWMAWQSPSGSGQTSTRPTLRVALLQGNVPQDLKFSAQAPQALVDYREALLHTQADMVVTPETALTFLPEQIPQDYWQTLRAVKDKVLLMGIPMRAIESVQETAQGSETSQTNTGPINSDSIKTGQTKRGGRFTNSVLGYVPGQMTDYRYDKHHLVPFGEFVPPMFQWFVDRMHIPLGEFAKGALPQPPLAWRGERISVNICFEDLFGEELAQSFADPAQTPTLLLNVSNLAWFGDTVALDQHLNIARMRALELHRPMLRATNTGATAWVDAQGQVVQKLPYETKGTLMVDVQGVDGPITPYAQWASRWGQWPLVGAMLLLWAMAAHMSRRSRHGQRRFRT
jgi:apolipoprotein N-acyltransferase